MFKRTLCMILVLVLALGMLPLTAGAAGADQVMNTMDTPRTYATQYAEVEPNNTRTTANTFNPNSQYVYGMVGDYYSIDDDLDWFKFTVSGAYLMVFEGYSGSMGNMKFYLYDSAGTQLGGAYLYEIDYENDLDVYAMEYVLTPGTYYIRVNEGAANMRSDYIFFLDLEPMLNAPSISASNVADTGKNKITWNSVSYAGSYKVLRSTSKNGSYTQLTTTTGTSYTDTSARAGTTYYYKVQAVSGSSSYLNSGYSNIVSRTCDLPRPTNLKSSRNATTGKVTLTWNAVSGADKYDIYASTDGSTYTKIGSVTGTSVTHNSATLGQRYYYKIRAVDSDNSAATSAYSKYVTGTAVCAKPVLTVSNVASSGKIKISWSKVTGAAKYTLYIYDSNGNLLKSTTTTNTALTHTSAVAGKTYTYKLKAIGSVSAANSSLSEAKSRTCDLAAPTLTVTTTSSGKPKLSWGKVTGAVKYKVYVSTNGGSSWNLLTTITGTSVTHNSATKGVTYRYKVMAVASNSAANSAYSSVKSVTSR